MRLKAAMKRRDRKFRAHLENEGTNRIVDKLIAGERLAPSEVKVAGDMHRLIAKLVVFKKKLARDQNPAPIDVKPKPVRNTIRIPLSSAPKNGFPPRVSFYSTEEWKRLRYGALVKSNGKCLACGASPRNGATLRVDHIIPISKAPHLRADPSNLQVLCNDCNWGKGGWDQTDWRGEDPRYGELKLVANNGRWSDA